MVDTLARFSSIDAEYVYVLVTFYASLCEDASVSLRVNVRPHCVFICMRMSYSVISGRVRVNVRPRSVLQGVCVCVCKMRWC